MGRPINMQACTHPRAHRPLLTRDVSSAPALMAYCVCVWALKTNSINGRTWDSYVQYVSLSPCHLSANSVTTWLLTLYFKWINSFRAVQVEASAPFRYTDWTKALTWDLAHALVVLAAVSCFPTVGIAVTHRFPPRVLDTVVVPARAAVWALPLPAARLGPGKKFPAEKRKISTNH